MLKIIGIVLILFGLWWLYRPGRLKKKFTKKIKRSTRMLLFFALFFLGSFLISASKNLDGFRPKFLIFFGFLVLVYALFTLNKKTREKLYGYLQKIPIWVWRLLAVLQILVGVLLQFIK